ncbi:MAG: GtrA family protein [Dorea sp.]|nr:GtrA family protein [Dorea sp.]
MKKLIEQIMKFGVVGFICFGIDYGLMILLTEAAGISYLVSSGLSFSISVIVNYTLSLKFVFETNQENNKIVEFLVFIILSVIGLGINQVLMWVCVDKFHIFYMISKVGVTGVVMVYNFVTRKLILEKSR